MPKSKLLVIAKEGDPYLPMLDRLRETTDIKVAPSAKAFGESDLDAEALLVWNTRREDLEYLLPRAGRLRWIHARWAGLDSLLFPELVESDVILTNSRGVYSQSLGEFVILGALFFAKSVRRLIQNQAEHKWSPFVMLELRGATMGIVGYGDIGRACASRAHSLGMRVLAQRRRPEQSTKDPYVFRVYGPDELVEMVGECDYVVAAAPLTPATRGMIGKEQIAAMKPTAVLMNVGRGPVIDEAALIDALREKRIRGAALDVFSTEPLPPDSPLFEMDNVLISPHCADNTPTWNEEAMEFFLANFERFAGGLELHNVVDKRSGY